MSKRSKHDHTYNGLAHRILKQGLRRDNDRTGTGTIGLFGEQLKFDLADGFPLLTCKKVYTRAIIHELLWFISGSTNIEYLKDNNVTIWDEWADENGDLGPVYGEQWRQYVGINLSDPLDPVPTQIDQLAQVIENIRNNPDSRRHIVSAWNVTQIGYMALPPCHCLFQFSVLGGKLHLQLYQRSADLFLGVPFNIASYAILLQMVAQCTGYEAGVFTHTFGDVHIYSNHIEQMKEQIQRPPLAPPKLWLNPDITEIDDFSFEDIEIRNYQSHPAIKGEVSV